MAFADRGLQVGAYDIDPAAVRQGAVRCHALRRTRCARGLERVIASSRLVPTTDPAIVSRAEHIVVVIGTPVDEHLNPDPQGCRPP